MLKKSPNEDPVVHLIKGCRNDLKHEENIRIVGFCENSSISENLVLARLSII